jgi:hypothetical protein
MKKFIIYFLFLGSCFTMHASHEKVPSLCMPAAVEHTMYSKLFTLIDQGELSNVQAYFSAFPCDVNHCDEHGASLLMHAVRHHRVQVIIYLIYRKADIFHKDDQGMSPLTQAEWEDDHQSERGAVPLLPLLVQGWLLKTFPQFFKSHNDNHGSIRDLHNFCQSSFYLNLVKQARL